LDILNALIQVLIALLVILIPVGVVVGAILAVKMSNEQDKSKKKNIMWWMITSFVGPVVLLFVMLSAWGLIGILTNTFER